MSNLITISYDPEECMTLKIEHYVELFSKARKCELAEENLKSLEYKLRAKEELIEYMKGELKKAYESN